MLYPKPKRKRQRRAKNNPVPTDHDKCVICDAPYASLHEVFYGKNRQNSIKYKMQVRLCERHHTGPEGVHHNPALDKKFKRHYQKIFETAFGKEEFIRIFGKDYLVGEVA